MGYRAEVILKSRSPFTKKEVTTIYVRYPLFIHAEMMTHRVFSRNAASNRSIRSSVLRKQVRENPAMPLQWQENKPGMQSSTDMKPWKARIARMLWRSSAYLACGIHWGLEKLGLHKQWTNRVLNPYQYIDVLITSTDWSNFFELRCHRDAQPEIQKIASMMREAINSTEAVVRSKHIPFYPEDEKRAVAQCARVTNQNTGRVFDEEADHRLYHRLMEATPMHASPAEHVCFATTSLDNKVKNLQGWKTWRQIQEERRYEIETY